MRFGDRSFCVSPPMPSGHSRPAAAGLRWSRRSESCFWASVQETKAIVRLPRLMRAHSLPLRQRHTKAIFRDCCANEENWVAVDQIMWPEQCTETSIDMFKSLPHYVWYDAPAWHLPLERNMNAWVLCLMLRSYLE